MGRARGGAAQKHLISTGPVSAPVPSPVELCQDWGPQQICIYIGDFCFQGLGEEGWPPWSAEWRGRRGGARSPVLPGAQEVAARLGLPGGGSQGAEGSLGTWPGLTACPSTLPAARQQQLGVGSAPRAWERGQRPVPAKDQASRSAPVTRCHRRSSSLTHPTSLNLSPPRKPRLRGAQQAVRGGPAFSPVLWAAAAQGPSGGDRLALGWASGAGRSRPSSYT